jgi:hypothetical protein
MNRILPLILALSLASSPLFGQTLYNLSFLNGSSSGGQFCVDFYMSYDQVAKLGSSNLYFTFDKTNLTNPSVSSTTIGPPFYDNPTITVPGDGISSINIVLNATNFGEQINTTNTKVGTICFDVADMGAAIQLNWITTGTYESVVFLDNQSTRLSPGTMVNWSGAAFPVEWLSFLAEQKDTDAILDWSTASEINNKQFEIERSIDGQTFEIIGKKAGKGNTNGVSDYTYVDRGAGALGFRKLYYRLRQVDYDGTFEYSPTVELSIVSDKTLAITGYPNPFANELNIRFSSIVRQDLQIEILSALGQKIYSYNTTDIEGELRVDVSNWAEGLYYLSIVGGTKREVFKILKE